LFGFQDQQGLQQSASSPRSILSKRTTQAHTSLKNPMSLSSILSVLSAIILAFTVLSAGQAKLTSQITPEIHEIQVAKDSETSPHESRIPIPPATRRKIHGVINVVCGILLLWPSRRKIGAAAAFVLLSWGLVSRFRGGMSVVPPLTMMALSAFVWFL